MQLKTALCVNADILVTILRNNALPLLILGRVDIIILYQYDDKMPCLHILQCLLSCCLLI